MKKILLTVLAITAMFFAVSCSEDDVFDALGGSCDVNGTETCSPDGSQILVCSDYTWQIKKSCNLNFGQYCRQTASGSFSCTDNGNSSDPTDPENTDNTDSDLPDPNQNDNEPTDPEPADDSEPANDNDPEPADDNEPANDNDPEPSDDSDSAPDNDTDSDTQPSDNDNDTPPEPGNTIPAPSDCANIMNCMDNCATDSNGNLVDSNCPQNCYNNGTSKGITEYNNWADCNDSHSCNYYYDCLWANCRDEEALCGLAGDTSNYKIPYGKAIINGTFNYLNNQNSTSPKTISGAFATGTFGNNGKLAESSSSMYSYAVLVEGDSSSDDSILLIQVPNNLTDNSVITRMFIKATSAGTYTFGLGDFNTEKVRLFVNNWDDDESTFDCDHAFGYGSITISSIGYTTGDTTISVSGEVDIYSYKAMPYYGGDITDSNFIACSPK